MNQNTNQNTSLGTGSMFPLLIKMAVPPMISMLIQSLYNIVDSIFVARLSSNALSAVSIIFPIQNLSLALAVGTGVGLNSYIARNMGAGNQQAADDKHHQVFPPGNHLHAVLCQYRIALEEVGHAVIQKSEML